MPTVASPPSKRKFIVGDGQTGPKLTVGEIARYKRLDKERLAHVRKASDIAKEQATIEEAIVAYVEAYGGRQRTVVKGKYTLKRIWKTKPVQWAKAFIRRLGNDEAEAERKKAGRVLKLEIT